MLTKNYWESLRRNPAGSVPALLFMILLMASCNRQKDLVGETGKVPAAVDSTCYLFAQKGDTIALSVAIQDGMVRGNLAFLFHEKDKSRGTIEGDMKGDTLIAGYQFSSEGILSFRQVAFLKRDGFLIMGSGDILNMNNREVFKDPKRIDFTGGVVLRETLCPE
jgi:hypothetical protein